MTCKSFKIINVNFLRETHLLPSCKTRKSFSQGELSSYICRRKSYRFYERLSTSASQKILQIFLNEFSRNLGHRLVFGKSVFHEKDVQTSNASMTHVLRALHSKKMTVQITSWVKYISFLLVAYKLAKTCVYIMYSANAVE